MPIYVPHCPRGESHLPPLQEATGFFQDGINVDTANRRRDGVYELYERVQVVMTDRQKSKHRRRTFAFSGLLVCGNADAP
jgi:hypothetical protein